MAKFLTTTGISYYIEKVISEASKSITLVIPYLKLTNQLIERLNDAEKQNLKLTVIYGKDSLSELQKEILFKFNNAEIFFCKNLHSKCYFNEQIMVISSMNLYEFSERNNREMGILITRDSDREIYEDTLKEISSIKNSSKLEKLRLGLITEINYERGVEANETSTETYNEIWNFHLPLLFDKLKKSYPETLINFGKEIEIIDFPFKNVNTEIGSTLNFRFKEPFLFKNFKLKYQETLNKELAKTRVYWNYYVINVYPPKDYEIAFNESGKNARAEYIISIIETFKNIN